MFMDRIKRIAGKAKVSSTVQKDKDESLILFGELYRREKERDVNLLEPMYSVEFEAIQGGHHMFKLPSGKSRDFVMPGSEKHDYDWLKTPPATPLFPSLEMEPNSSKMVFQMELPILQSVQPSRFSSRPEAAKTSARSVSPNPSSSKSKAPTTARPNSSSRKNLMTGAPALSKEQNLAYRIDKRSSYTALTNRQHNAVPPAAAAANNTAKKSSDKQPASRGSSTNAVRKVANPQFNNKMSTNVVTTASILPPHAPSSAKAQLKDPTLGIGNLKVGSGNTRRLPCPPAAPRVSNKELQVQGVQNASAGNGRAQTGGEPAPSKGGRAIEAASKGRRRTDGEKQQRPKYGNHAKK